MSREIRAFVYGREYIPTSLAESSTCRLLIVTDDQIEVLRNLVNYAHQRRSWNDETIDDSRYYMPSDEDWDDIEALVSDLEDRLMSDCDFVTLDDANDRLGVNEPTPDHALVAVGDPIARLQDSTETMGLVLSEGDALLDAGDSVQVTAPTVIINANATKVQVGGVDGLAVLYAADGPRVGVKTLSPTYSLQILSESAAISPVIASENDEGKFALFFCGRSGGSQSGNAVVQADTGKKVRLLGTGGTEIVSGFGCNSKTPQTAYTVNAACTDLPTAVALLNQIRAALVANGICV